MTLLTPLLIWLAKQLIQYFLATNIELRKELEASVALNEEHTTALNEMRKREMALEKDRDEKSKYLTDLYYDITKLNAKIDENNKLHADKLHELEQVIANTSDSDIVRHEL